jgi:hypothetical protein
MIDLFKTTAEKKAKSVKEYTVECLNKERGIVCSLSFNPIKKTYATCLVLGNRAIKSTFTNPWKAEEQMQKYREQYK